MERPANTGSSQSNPLPPASTIFVQADPSTFRDLVQKHTGAAAGDSPDKLPVTTPPPSRTTITAVGPLCRPAFKLQDRRSIGVRKLEIKLGLTSLHHHHSPRSPHTPTTPQQHYLLLEAAAAAAKSSSIKSPVTPLGSDPLFSPPPAMATEEERAIAEKGFYLHPSPRGVSEPPELLPLFPLTSPKLSSRPSTEED